MIKGVLWEENKILHKQIVGEVQLGALFQIYTIGCKQSCTLADCFSERGLFRRIFQLLEGCNREC